jgi:hypothetical protein
MARPLEKTRRDGTLYTRSSEIEAAIDTAIGQDLETVCDQTQISNPRAKNYLPSEILVYLIREARRNGQEEAQSKLLVQLLERCAAILISKVPDSGIATAPQLREDILGDFAELFGTDGSLQDRHELDFYEVRFNLAFRTFRITRVRTELDRLNSTRALPDPASPGVPIDSEVLARLSDLSRTASDPEQFVIRKQLEAAIRALPKDERDALVLCRLIGLKEESEDPNELTAATLCGVTGRTIRYRLATALEKLSGLKEDL